MADDASRVASDRDAQRPRATVPAPDDAGPASRAASPPPLIMTPAPCQRRGTGFDCAPTLPPTVIPAGTADTRRVGEAQCTLSLDGVLACEGAQGPRVTHPLPAGIALATDDMAGRVCALGPERVVCGGVETLATEPVLPLAGAVKIDAGLGLVCGVLPGAVVLCLAPDEPDRPARTFHGATDVAIGTEHACVLVDGAVQCWGRYAEGQLGDGHLRLGWDTVEETPRLVNGLDDAVEITAGDGFTCALRGDGSVWCWGIDTAGELGRGVRVGASGTAAAVVGIGDAQHVAAGESQVCAIVADTTLRCWGRGPDGMPRPTPGRPDEPHQPLHPLATGCAEIDLVEWKARLQAASGREALVPILAELGLQASPAMGDEPWELMPKLIDVRAREAELAAAPGKEILLEVSLTAEGPEPWQRLDTTAVQVLYADGDRWCLAGSDLSTDLLVEMRACMPHPVDGDMEGPQVLDFVELLEPGRMAIRRREQDGACGMYPRMSGYHTSLWAVRDGTLVEVFPPFETYYEAHSVYPEPEWHEGRLRIEGGLPRRIRTVLHVRCEDTSEFEDPDDPPPPCTAKTTRKTWRFDGARYR